jgi:peptide/nickel transport system substrate-binding protein
VVYTFKRLQDPNVGSPLGKSLTGVDIKAVDPTHVQFTLTDPNPEFPAQVSDYHAAILSKSVQDPTKTWVGTGPFILESYAAEDRASLKKNPNYWMKDDQGNALPYLDAVELVFSPDLAGQVSALQGGQVQFVGGLSSELVDSIKKDKNLKVLTGPSSAFHYVIHMRSDAGHPAADPKIRQALQLGTDHQALIDVRRNDQRHDRERRQTPRDSGHQAAHCAELSGHADHNDVCQQRTRPDIGEYFGAAPCVHPKQPGSCHPHRHK